MMQKIAGLIALVLVLLAFTAVMPAAAEDVVQDQDLMEQMTTYLNIEPGCGQDPIIKAKWERNVWCPFDDSIPLDDSPRIPGSQFEPSCIPDKPKLIKICSVVTDPDGLDDIRSVEAKIYRCEHLAGVESVEIDSRCNWVEEDSFYLNRIENNFNALAEFWIAKNYDCIVKYNGYPPCEIMCELNPCLPWCRDGDRLTAECTDTLADPLTFTTQTDYEAAVASQLTDVELGCGGCDCRPDAGVFCQVWEFPCDLPAGLYKVKIVVKDGCENTAEFRNFMLYKPNCCCDYDFNQVSYGTITSLGTWIHKYGDDDFSTPTCSTVWNLGNQECAFGVRQDNMNGAFALDDIKYKAQLNDNGWVEYNPGDLTRIPGLLPPCMKENVDFAVMIMNCPQTGSFSGKMKFGSFCPGCRAVADLLQEPVIT